MKTARIAGTGLCLLLLVPAVGFAWGEDGHRIIAGIADVHLMPQARDAVRYFLGDDSLADVSTWADEIRSIPAYRWADVLHYVNLPPGTDAFDMQRDCPREGCVVSAVFRYEDVLRRRHAETALRIEALKLVVHFVGDIHQPLHVSRTGDRGGNDIRVTFFGEPMNLHEVWDTALIARTGRTREDYTRELLVRLESDDTLRREAERMDPAAWATESHRLALAYAYAVPEGGRLDQAYFERSIPIVDHQLAVAGLRLAAVLNAVFEEETFPRASRRTHSRPTSRPSSQPTSQHGAGSGESRNQNSGGTTKLE